MGILDRASNFLEKMKSLKTKEVESIKYTLFFLLIVDMIGVYWYLGAKKIGVAIMLVCLVILGFLLFLHPNNNQNTKGGHKMEKKEKKEEKREEEVGEDEPSLFGDDLGLPNAEEYNERLKDALG